jgi:hypothetical protein
MARERGLSCLLAARSPVTRPDDIRIRRRYRPQETKTARPGTLSDASAADARVGTVVTSHDPPA